MKRLVKVMFCGVLLLAGCQKKQEETPVVEEEKVTIVSNDVYADPKNPSNVYAKTFNELTEALKNGDMEKVSENVALCFVYDFFTMKNKESSQDVGGLAYLPQNRVEEFTQFAQQHFYKNYDSILAEYGADSLPEVVNVKIDSKAEKTVMYLDEDYKGYEYEMSVEYALTKLEQEELKTKITMTCLVYNGKALVISVK